MLKILFVCTGNICRSPIAEETFRRAVKMRNLQREIQCDSAATHGYHIGSQPDTFTIPTVDGKQKEYFKYGILSFKIKGEKLQLYVYQSLALMRIPKYKNYLFIPFKDFTSGKETYGGGRYLDIEMTDIQTDVVILDFNKAYNPYCAFGDGFSCPVPPKENHLKSQIKAGEKNFKKPH